MVSGSWLASESKVYKNDREDTGEGTKETLKAEGPMEKCRLGFPVNVQ